MTEEMRICPKCGFAMPLMTTKSICPVCKTYWPGGKLCSHCGEFSEWIHRSDGYCLDCKHMSDRLWRIRKNKNIDKQYKDWLDLMNGIPGPLVTLTEDDWLRVCSYFEGQCSICHEGVIDARMYFVDFKQGGRYTSYNIIPVCEKCATKRRADTYQPFRYFDYNFNNYKLQKGTLDKIIKYLSKEIDKAYAAGKNRSV